MYQVNKRTKQHRWPLFILLCGIVVLLAGGAVWTSREFDSPTVIVNAPTVARTVTAQSAAGTIVTTKQFSLTLPYGWQAAPPNTLAPYPTSSWVGEYGDDSARRIDIYIDSTPSTLGVNRIIPVTAHGATLVVNGIVSDNCADAAVSHTSAPLLTTLSGVSFLCDEANYNRDVVGIAAAQAINQVTISAPSGKHAVFITYTDNSPDPDYTIFVQALNSFTLR
jgi:hypothetical protein